MEHFEKQKFGCDNYLKRTLVNKCEFSADEDTYSKIFACKLRAIKPNILTSAYQISYQDRSFIPFTIFINRILTKYLIIL